MFKLFKLFTFCGLVLGGLTKTYRDCRDGSGAVVSETVATVSLRNYRLFGKTVNGGPKFQYPLHSNHNTMTLTLTPNPYPYSNANRYNRPMEWVLEFGTTVYSYADFRSQEQKVRMENFRSWDFSLFPGPFFR